MTRRIDYAWRADARGSCETHEQNELPGRPKQEAHILAYGDGHLNTYTDLRSGCTRRTV